MIKIYPTFKPVVSVIMATYNRANFLKRSLDSMINQSFKEWELLIVDDGSSDNSYDIIKDYITNYENIRYLKHQNRKLPLTRNTGILASVGDYITFLDSDDEYDKNHLRLRYNFMIGNTDTDLIHGGIQIIGDPYVIDKNSPGQKIHLEQCAIGGTFFGKRKIFLELGGFSTIGYSEDSEFLERVEEKYIIRKVHYATYVYHREVRDSITNLKIYETRNEEQQIPDN
jgi:glycosyltransferase involved in cell wall biosynthesis